MYELFENLGYNYQIVKIDVTPNSVSFIIMTHLFMYVNNVHELRKTYPGRYLMIPYQIKANYGVRYDVSDGFTDYNPMFSTIKIDLYA